MQLPTFIRLEHTFEKAMEYRNSPQMTNLSFNGVQLLPFNEYPYIQRTYNDDGIEIENYTVYVCDLCQNRLQDITDYFEVINNFNDPGTGLPQVDWQLKNVPFDFNYRLVYLEIVQGVNEQIFSTPFMLTDFRSKYVSRFDYKNVDSEQMMSIGLQFYFKQLDDFQEITTYDTITTGRRTTITTKLVPYEVWNTSRIEISIFRLIKRLFKCKFIYLDFQRSGLFEAFDTPRLEADENFAEAEITLTRNENDTFNPNAVPIIPPPPPVNAPTINLTQITRPSNGTARYYFNVENFAPTYLTLQYSQDQVTWNSNTGGVTSPRDNNVVNSYFVGYYYRITHEQATSSVIYVPPIALSLGSVVPIGGLEFSLYHSAVGYIPPSGRLIYETSNNNTNWIQAAFNVGNESPKFITAKDTVPVQRFFRVVDPINSIISNVIELPE